MNRYRLFKAGVDVNQGLKRMDDDIEFYEKMLKKFREDDYCRRLQDALGKSDADKAFQYAHALKGAAGNLSLVRISEAVVPLVEELRKGDAKMAEQYLPEVKTAYDALMEALGDS